MRGKILERRSVWQSAAAVILLLCTVVAVSSARSQGQMEGSSAPRTAKDNAPFDMTGYWVSIVNEDWRWRMLTPAKGDYASVPLNAEGTKVADTWDAAKDEAEGNQCKAYGAGNIMRIPERLHVTWTNDSTLRMDTDEGMQTRLFHFDGSKWQGGSPQWQGDSVAMWEKETEIRGSFGGSFPGKRGNLAVVTRHMRAGYLRTNGVPYSENAVLTEYYDRIDINGQSYLIVTSAVDDPQYLRERFITSGQFKREPEGSKWSPAPCRPLWPRPPKAPAVHVDFERPLGLPQQDQGK
jgi:hypothetical protein